MRRQWRVMDGARFLSMAMERTGLNQRELGARIGVSQVNLSHVLHGRHKLTMPLRILIAQQMAAVTALASPRSGGREGCMPARVMADDEYLAHLPTCPSCLGAALDAAKGPT